MPEFFNPPDIGKPLSRYSHGAIIETPGRLLFMSGQVGMDPDGKLETGFAAQAERAWSNLFAILRAAGMEKRHLVKVTYFLIRPTDLPVLREIRDRVLEGNAPAATLLFVAALATPDLLIEIEAVAAR